MSVQLVTRVIVASLFLVALTGCASSRKKITQVWPAAPSPPRVQFLRKITDSVDVVGKKSVSLIDLGKEENKVVPLVKPYGIAVGKGKLYICDTVQAQVVIYNLKEKTASVLSGNKGAGQLKKPINVAVDAGGFVYVADSARKQVLKYAPDGSFVKGVGEENMKPVAVAADELYLYVLDNAKALVHLYDLQSLALVRSFGQEGEEKGRLFNPLGLGLDGKGGVYVSNLDGRLVHFDRDGHGLRMFGKLGTGLAEYNRPRALAFDKVGVMYVVDAASQNVRLMNDAFQLLMSFGEPGTPGSLNVPAGIAVSDDDLAYYQQFAEPDFSLEQVIFVVSQFGEHKISIYGLGKQKGVNYDAEVAQRLEEIRKQEEKIEKANAEKAQKEKEKAEKENEKAAAEEKKDSAAPAPSGNK